MQVTIQAGIDAVGVVMGARVAIILTRGADSRRTHVASCAVAVRVARARTVVYPRPVSMEV